MGGSRKYPYPYHGRHLGIPKGRGHYKDWNSKDMGGSLDWNSEGIGRGFQEIFFQFGVVKLLIISKLIRKDFSKDDDLLVNTSFLMSNGLTMVTFSHGRLYHSVGSS